MSMSDAMGSEGFLEMVDLMIDDQWSVLTDTQIDHDRRCRAFLLLAMALSTTPESHYTVTAHRLQERLNGLPPIIMINTIHVLADSMATMLALGFQPPLGFGSAE